MAELLRGRLRALRLPSLLQSLEGELLSGVLHLDDQADISFSDGRVVGASCKGLSGVDALFEAFLVEAEGFVFEEGAPTGTSMGDALSLALEGCRLADEWSRHRSVVFAKAQDPAPDGLAAVWPYFDGRRTLERALRAADRGRSPFLSPIETAVREGALTPLSTSTMPAVTDADDAARRGREALRSGDPATAAAWFAEAVDLRPDDRALRQNLRHAQQLASGSSRWPTYAR